MAHVIGLKGYRRKRKILPNAKSGHRPLVYKHNYKNYKPFNPDEIKEHYLYANRRDKHKPPEIENIEDNKS